MILVNGQWQGGGEPRALEGVKELEALYLKGKKPYLTAEADPSPQLEMKHQILGYDIILRQTAEAARLLAREKPDTLFTIGGSCDADVASLAYLSQKYGGDLTMFWFDAHGDLNAPEESVTHLYYGMPGRTMLEPQLGFTDLVPVPMKPENWVQIGGRDFDPPETTYLKKHDITHLSVQQAEGDAIDAVLRERAGRNAYIHFDLDVLDPAEFVATPLPSANGLAIRRVLELFEKIEANTRLVGMGLFEYTPVRKRLPWIEAVLDFADRLNA